MSRPIRIDAIQVPPRAWELFHQLGLRRVELPAPPPTQNAEGRTVYYSRPMWEPIAGAADWLYYPPCGYLGIRS